MSQLLDPESEQIRDVYAHYGLAMFHAQCLERSVAMVLAAQDGVNAIDCWAYEERLADNFAATFGILAGEFASFSKSHHIELGKKILAAVETRNWLAHHYFWERGVQFCSMDGRRQMLSELKRLAELFEGLDEQVSQLNADFLKQHGISEAEVEEIATRLTSGLEPPTDAQQLDRQIVITSVHDWQFSESHPHRRRLLFKTDSGENLLLGESGLCRGPGYVPESALKLRVDFNVALPATVDPRPRRAKPWNYRIILGHGYELSVREDKTNDGFVRRYSLHKTGQKSTPAATS